MSPDASVQPSSDAEPAGDERVGAADPGSASSPLADEERPGAQLGPYTLIEPIGEGGFGTVWVAEQIAPVRRRVALKLLKPGMASREILARFAAEQQALARKVAESDDATPWDFSQLAWYLSSGPLEDVYDLEQALVWAERANEASGWLVPRCLDGLAFARFAVGDLDGALDAQRQALAVMPPNDEMRGYHEEVVAEWEALRDDGD